MELIIQYPEAWFKHSSVNVPLPYKSIFLYVRSAKGGVAKIIKPNLWRNP